jgi:hypothetical protein
MVPIGPPERHRFGATPAAGHDRPVRRGIVVAVFDHVTIRVSDREHPVTRGLHIAWFAPTVDDVQAFWQAGINHNRS